MEYPCFWLNFRFLKLHLKNIFSTIKFLNFEILFAQTILNVQFPKHNLDFEITILKSKRGSKKNRVEKKYPCEKEKKIEKNAFLWKTKNDNTINERYTRILPQQYICREAKEKKKERKREKNKKEKERKRRIEETRGKI